MFFIFVINIYLLFIVILSTIVKRKLPKHNIKYTLFMR